MKTFLILFILQVLNFQIGFASNNVNLDSENNLSNNHTSQFAKSHSTHSLYEAQGSSDCGMPLNSDCDANHCANACCGVAVMNKQVNFFLTHLELIGTTSKPLLSLHFPPSSPPPQIIS